MPYVKVESYQMDVCYTLSFIIKSNIGAETQELTHKDACALVRRQLHYFLNATEVTLVNICQIWLVSKYNKHNNAQIVDLDELCMTISTMLFKRYVRQ